MFGSSPSVSWFSQLNLTSSSFSFLFDKNGHASPVTIGLLPSWVSCNIGLLYVPIPSCCPSPALSAHISIYIWLYPLTVQCIDLYIYPHRGRKKIVSFCFFVLFCYFASFYLSNCDVIGFRPKVCYCNTFTEKKGKKEKMLL